MFVSREQPGRPAPVHAEQPPRLHDTQHLGLASRASLLCYTDPAPKSLNDDGLRIRAARGAASTMTSGAPHDPALATPEHAPSTQCERPFDLSFWNGWSPRQRRQARHVLLATSVEP